jgi:hypothetical protein
LRTEKHVAARGEEACSAEIDLARIYLEGALERVHAAGKHAVCGFAEGDTLRLMLLGLKRYTKTEPFNAIAARRRVADRMVAADAYPF